MPQFSPRATKRFLTLTACLPLIASTYLPGATAPAGPAAEARDALPRWRESLADLEAAIPALGEYNLIELEDSDTPLPPLDEVALLDAAVPFARLRLYPGETIQLARLHGPETPFPDHHPLRQLAAFRTLLVRRALDAGDHAAALRLARQGLEQARATLANQAGIVPLIHASGVWQSALDAAHAIIRSPATTSDELREIIALLQSDSGLAALAGARALQGELDDVYRVIVERMPATDDPDLLLSSVASLGMAPPEPPEPGELVLGRTSHPLLDPASTIAAYAADLAPILEELRRTPDRYPRGAYAVTIENLRAYNRELGDFATYARGELAPTLANIVRARVALERATNPVGKLLATYLTPPREVILASLYRREAQRSALLGLAAWRLHGHPAPWSEIVAAGLLAAPPADPFSGSPLRCATEPAVARVWSVFINGTDAGGEGEPGNVGMPDDLVWRP